METSRTLERWQRWLIGLLCLSLGLMPLAGCETRRQAPEPTAIHVVAVVIDEQRLAGPGEGEALRVWRNGAWLPAPAGTVLFKGDRVQTAGNATAVIRWPGLGDAYLRPGSAGTIGSLDELVNEVLLKVKGAFAARTRLVGSVSKGTVFLARGMQDGSLAITVLESEVEMSSRSGAWSPVTLRAGQTGTGGLRAPLLRAATAAELQATRDWAERIERLLPRSTSGRGSSGVGGAVAVGVAAVAAAILLSRSGKQDEVTPSAASPSSGGDRGTGTAGASDPGSAGSAGGAMGATPARQLPLGAPTGLSPGSTSERSPGLSTCKPVVTVQWNAVAGAQQYEALIEQRPPGQGWRTVARPRVAGTTATAGPGDTSSVYRFSVRAMAGERDGLLAGPVYFMCNTLR